MVRPELCTHYSSRGVSGGAKESCLAQITGLKREIIKTNDRILVYQVQIDFSCMKRKPRASCLTGLTLTHLGKGNGLGEGLGLMGWTALKGPVSVLPDIQGHTV